MSRLSTSLKINIEELLLESGWPAIHLDPLQLAVSEKLMTLIAEKGMPAHLAETDPTLRWNHLNVTLTPSINTTRLADSIAQALYQGSSEELRG